MAVLAVPYGPEAKSDSRPDTLEMAMIDAASLLLEVREGEPDQADRVHDVDVEARLPVLLRVGDRQSTDVGDDHVEAAHRGRGLLDPCCEGIGITDIERRADSTAPGA